MFDSPVTIHSAIDFPTRALPDPDGSPTRGPHLRRFAQDRHPVGREGDEAVDRVLHADGFVADDLGHELERVLHLRVEVGLREWELGRREGRLLDRGDLLGVVEDRAVGIRADLEADPVLSFVHEDVHVAHDRELDRPRRALEARHGTDVDHLVDDGGERDPRAGHLGDHRAPDAGRDDDVVDRDVAA
jgi:hypothetical protein